MSWLWFPWRDEGVCGDSGNLTRRAAHLLIISGCMLADSCQHGPVNSPSLWLI